MKRHKACHRERGKILESPKAVGRLQQAAQLLKNTPFFFFCLANTNIIIRDTWAAFYIAQIARNTRDLTCAKTQLGKKLRSLGTSLAHAWQALGRCLADDRRHIDGLGADVGCWAKSY